MMKKKKTSKTIKDLHLDKPTSHGGWPDGHSGSYTDPNTPVAKQISDYLESMGLIDDSNPRARLSEDKIRAMIRETLSESFGHDYNYGFTPLAMPGDEYEILLPNHPNKGTKVKVKSVEESRDGDITYYVEILNHPTGTKLYFNYSRDDFHKVYSNTYMAPRY